MTPSAPETKAPLPVVVVILGPTGSGKTALSLGLAEKFAGEVVNCDSVAIYREFEIGTAKPSKQERARVPHHLFDIAAATDVFNAGEYARRARIVLAEIAGRGKLPIVVGGTGLYLRALLDGLFAGPPRSEELRARLRADADEKGPQHLHQMLAASGCAATLETDAAAGHAEEAHKRVGVCDRRPRGAPMQQQTHGDREREVQVCERGRRRRDEIAERRWRRSRCR